MRKITILGAGSWGTTIASMLAHKGFKASLWARSGSIATSISENRENKLYLPGVRLPENIQATSSLEEALTGTALVVCVVPSHGIRGVMERARDFVPADAIVVSASKGIEDSTLLTPTGILKELLRGVLAKHPEIVALSGPSFAKEVSMRLPTAVSAASKSQETAEEVQQIFSAPHFRVYTNTDVTGVELGGALKNVIAIAAGISDGLRLGSNARAALITRGLAEMTRLGVKMGAQPATFMGLSGVGDLVLTCTGTLSRNYTVGVSMGERRSLNEITSGMRMIAEGVKTSRAARMLGKDQGVVMPITEAVYSVLYKGKPPEEAVYDLMSRVLKDE